MIKSFILLLSFILKLNALINHIKTNIFNKKYIFTIIGINNKKTNDLIKCMNDHKINNIYINKYYLSKFKIIQLKKKFNIPQEFNESLTPLVFLNNEYFIGGDFEMYECIKYY
jgi:hypothetical protein